MSEIQNAIEQAEKYCKMRGVRLTEKRKQVLTGLLQSKRPLSTYELIDYCKEHLGEEISAMSTYRILDFLDEENLVHKISRLNKYVACSHINCDHNHGVSEFLICRVCSKVKEVTVNPSTMSMLQVSAEKAGFTLTSRQLEMDCVCNECIESEVIEKVT
ncbi:transcriptional repressor [Veronia nyctiphanis]|uniref:Transcriptional repressor n=1 Tax=Veronia nyctiphanis TaxID=1278244 RepID=A0A4Q0YS36_9GAMM|nr:Fur family transcriptional regulator [Veronia nyctiphanis]RXJ73946.1 transcriptional repressor [Veronia nyctiphanis]